ncbi:hypothetical protein ENUP19_0218G0021 [Entamoeba nuttalli]|uniref:Tetraspanin family protein n=2 Tax=Entamoeba nuttalli TaxID=412467 RepID=K2HAV6_ENTNP|nr:hypothetical protein ENU1_114550 [Entamoeba nuttalli P19]EKE39799.1 hypothetical protein ENU1_114550 [Entamoeba nuttalli P19]|eukprot:XP_008857878.1 hypothetical protein ENU1_114550 [Entamoeba nuttalli P19]
MGCSSCLTFCVSGVGIILSILAIIFGLLQVISTSKMNDFDIKDAQIDIITSYVSIAFSGVILIVFIIVTCISCFNNRVIKMIIAILVVIVGVLCVGGVICFGGVGYKNMYKSSFEELWNKVQNIIMSYAFEQYYSCCGYNKVTKVCGCYLNENYTTDECNTTCYDRIIKPLGIFFFLSSGVYIFITITAVILTILLLISVFCHRAKGYYNQL